MTVSASVQREKLKSRAAEHRLDEPTGLSLGMVASLQSPPPFPPGDSLYLRRSHAVLKSRFPPSFSPHKAAVLDYNSDPSRVVNILDRVGFEKYKVRNLSDLNRPK